ncbi:MAG TPA: sugar ABC transporter substrate-binding protein [Epulopiscium sp.]|nr:sugar ABC transporter substrate-binding protein [Candidatus Epulonipiscium sp.]
MSTKARGIGIILLCVLVLGVFQYNHHMKHQMVEISLGIYSRNKWKIPHLDSYRVYDEVIRDFEAKNPNVRVTYRSGTLMDDYSEWLAKTIMYGEEPDVFIILDEDFNTYASIGLFQDLTKYIEKDKSFDLNHFYKKALDNGRYGTKQYGIPFGIAPTFMIVNTTLLDKEGITLDKDHWTWDDFYNICKKVTKDTNKNGQIDQFGVFGYEWEHAFYTNDKALFTDDGLNIAFEDEKLYETINFMKKMHQLNKTSTPRDQDFDKGQVAFKMFSLPEYRGYTSSPYQYLKYTDFEWESIPLPSGPSGKSVSKLDTIQLGMSSRSKNKKKAWEFIKFLTYDHESQQSVWDNTYILPSNRKMVEEIYETSTQDEEKNILEPYFLNRIIESGYIDPRFKKYSDFKEILDKNIFLMISRDENINQGIAKIKKDIKKQR